MYPPLSRAFEMIASALGRVGQRGANDPLIVAMPAMFAAGWFLPRMHSYRAIPLATEIIVRSSGLLDPGVEGVAAAVRHGRAGWRDLDCIHLFSDVLMPVCSPGYRGSCLSTLGSLPDFEECTILVLETDPDIWSKYGEACSIPVGRCRRLVLGDEGLVLQGALNGLGMALLDRNLTLAALQSNALVQALVETWTRGTAWYLVFPSGLRSEKRFADLIAWLTWEIASPHGPGLDADAPTAPTVGAPHGVGRDAPSDWTSAMRRTQAVQRISPMRSPAQKSC